MGIASLARQREREDLLRMLDGGRFELVGGELVEKYVRFWASYVGGQMFDKVNGYVRDRGVGYLNAHPPISSSRG